MVLVQNLTLQAAYVWFIWFIMSLILQTNYRYHTKCYRMTPTNVKVSYFSLKIRFFFSRKPNIAVALQIHSLIRDIILRLPSVRVPALCTRYQIRFTRKQRHVFRKIPTAFNTFYLQKLTRPGEISFPCLLHSSLELFQPVSQSI